MKHLARLAAEGHTCLATIHQPRAAIWEFLNKVPRSAHICGCLISSTRIHCAKLQGHNPAVPMQPDLYTYYLLVVVENFSPKVMQYLSP